MSSPPQPANRTRSRVGPMKCPMTSLRRPKPAELPARRFSKVSTGWGGIKSPLASVRRPRPGRAQHSAKFAITGGGNPVEGSCPICRTPLTPPETVRPGPPARYCSTRCRRRAELWTRRAVRWERLARAWRARGTAEALERAVRCDARATRLRARTCGDTPEQESMRS